MDHGKWGVSIGGPFAESVLLRMNAAHSLSWLYNYNTRVDGLYDWNSMVARSEDSEQLTEWLRANKVAFVPMVAARSFIPLSGTRDKNGLCWLVTEFSPAGYADALDHARCTSDQIAAQLADLKQRLNVPTRFLMAANEPWAMQPAMSPEEAVEIWRR